MSEICFGNKIYKKSLIADNATCALDNVESIDAVLATIEDFLQHSGLKLYIDKSLLVYIGHWTRKPNIDHPVKVHSRSFNMLGVELGSDKSRCTKMNILDKIERIKTKFRRSFINLYGLIMFAKYITEP